MHLYPPAVITSRLLPGVRIGKTEISIDYAKKPGREGRTRYRYYIDAPSWSHTNDDLQSGVGGGSLNEGLRSLLAFLGAAAEYTGKEWDEDRDRYTSARLFPRKVTVWAHAHSDEISMADLELEEGERIIE